MKKMEKVMVHEKTTKALCQSDFIPQGHYILKVTRFMLGKVLPLWDYDQPGCEVWIKVLEKAIVKACVGKVWPFSPTALSLYIFIYIYMCVEMGKREEKVINSKISISLWSQNVSKGKK